MKRFWGSFVCSKKNNTPRKIVKWGAVRGVRSCLEDEIDQGHLKCSTGVYIVPSPKKGIHQNWGLMGRFVLVYSSISEIDTGSIANVYLRR